MVTSTGRQGLLSNLYRNDAVIGLKGPIPPPRLAAKPFPPPPPPPPPPPLPPALPVAGNNPTSSSWRLNLESETLSSIGGEDTNKSFNLCRTLTSLLPFLLLLLLLLFLDVGLGSESISDGESFRRENRRSVRLRSIRRVLRRRRWMTGLADGLRVGLPATTAHWVARSLNFCRVAIFIERKNCGCSRVAVVACEGEKLESEIWAGNMIGVGFGFHFHCALLFLLGRKNSEELREELRYDCEFLERERERESGKLREGGWWGLDSLETRKWKVKWTAF